MPLPSLPFVPPLNRLAIAALVGALVLVVGAGPSVAQSDSRTIDTPTGGVRVETLARGLDRPWGLAFLPDGRMLVTERPGRLRIVSADGTLSEPLGGVPAVFANGQGGLLDVALDPQFSQNRLVYLSYAEPGQGGASTAVARGRLAEGRLDSVAVIFRQEPKVSGPNHWGSRLAFAPDGTLFITTGDRFKFDPAQDLSGHIGKVIRIRPDGTVPQDNPFVGRSDARPEIWSFGHRNIQGAAIHPQTGKLWLHEHGPRGGDELNIPAAGRNYGWPLVSWGRHYSGEDIPDPPTQPQLASAIYQWTPVIAPSGMAFYTADRFSEWRGDLLIGGLRSRALVRLDLDGERVTGEHRIDMGARIRDVRQGPDGAVYLVTDEESRSRILRVTPAAG